MAASQARTQKVKSTQASKQAAQLHQLWRSFGETSGQRKPITGKVKHGEKIGRILGYPTANMRLHRQLPHGVYISLAKFKNRIYPALTFIGAPETFNIHTVRFETYLFGFSGNLYGEWLSVRLLKKMRHNKKFASKEELLRAMHADERAARKFFTTHSIQV